MHSFMHPALAHERGLDLLATATNARAARAARTGRPAPPEASQPDVAVAIRPARPADAGALVRLAQLDDHADHAPRFARLATEPWEGTVLVAQADGELAAALIVEDGTVVADPFEHTDGLVALLRLRGVQLAGASEQRWLPRVGAVLLPRLH